MCHVDDTFQVDMMVRECGVDVNSVDKKILSGHVTRFETNV